MKLVINLVLLPEASSASKTIWKSKETSSVCCFFDTCRSGRGNNAS